MPSRKRPPVIECIDIAVIATLAGVRAPFCRIPVPSLIVEVCEAT